MDGQSQGCKLRTMFYQTFLRVICSISRSYIVYFFNYLSLMQRGDFEAAMLKLHSA
ncbi:hypothetical protein BMETH_1471_0 [methanotrophic bacterial endosymbiont of Bathymodiolus sp.]|nr:hypothetical protein BMETH_1471_0 [methanotrophic bacterial endosymbiont of Bathymodiolus sp.]